MSLSMHSDSAVESITPTRRLSASMYVSDSKRFASGLTRGSSTYTASTLVALISTSALISIARSAAAVSVVK